MGRTQTQMGCDPLLGHCAADNVANSRLLPWIAEKPGRDLKTMLIGLVCCAAVLIYVQIKPYPMDVDANGILLADPIKMQTDTFSAIDLFCGSVIGLFIERRFICFSENITLKTRILRGIGGMALLGACFLLKSDIYAAVGKLWGHFTLYFLMLLIATAGWLPSFYPNRKTLNRRKSIRLATQNRRKRFCFRLFFF